MKTLLTWLTCLFLTGCTRPIGGYVVGKGDKKSARMSMMGGPFFPDLKCAPGVHTQKGFHKKGHDITLIGKGGQFQIMPDGFACNDVDNCLSDMGEYGYTLIEFSPPVSDVYFETYYDPEALMQCWLNYGQVGSPRGRYETGPGVFGYDPYQGTMTFGIGYDNTPRFVACWIYGEQKFRIGYIP